MECCVGVSTETVLQVVKFYPVVNWEKKISKTDVSDCSSSSKWMWNSDEGLQSETSVF